MQKRVFLLTGAPGVGKTTVLIKVVEALKAQGVSVGGMVSREARESGVRVGFEIVEITNGNHGWLARVDQQSGPQVGKYHVNLRDLENVGAKAITEAIEKCTVIAIDEIGPMELFSPILKQAVRQALAGEKVVLAVVHAKAKDSLVDEAKQRDDAAIFTVTFSNRDSIPKEIEKKVVENLRQKS